MKQIFASHASRFDKTAVWPVCRCHNTPPLPGSRQIIQGHVAYTPHLLPCEGTYLRPNDPLPLKGSKVRAQLIKGLTKCADQLGANLPPLHLHLPHSLWPETGSALHTTRLFAVVVSESHYVRIVDKGIGVMWAFCKHWVWSVLDEFLTAEGYVSSSLSVPQALAYIRSEIKKLRWSADSSRQLPLSYLLGKYKSLRKGHWLWRGITSLPQPPLPKKKLRIAARANSAFLKLLCNEVPCCFLAQSISDVSTWFQWLDTINA